MARHSTPGPLHLRSRLAGTGAFRLAAAWVAAASIAAGCSEAPKGRPCGRDQDCSAGSVCREGLCITPAVLAPSFTVDVTSPTRSATVNLTGTATGAVKVRVLDGGSEVGQANVTAGAWTFPLAPPEGTHVLTARAESAVGLLSEPSTEVTVVVDRTPPAPPVVTVAALTRAQPVPISGTTDSAGATIEIREGGTLLGTLTATGTTFDGTVPLAEGDHTLSVTAADPAGNVSTPTVKPVSVDRTPPPAPTLTLGVTSPTKVDPVPVSGTCSADAVSVQVLDGATPLATLAAASSAWAGNVTLGEGAASLRARAVDAAGNPSAESTPVALVVDRTPPGAPVVVAAAITNAQPVPLSGTTDSAGAVIEIREGAALLGAALSTGTTWAKAVTLAEGDHALSVTAIDAAGNVSAATPKQVTVDRTRPQVVSRSPVPGSASHDFRQKILVSFDEPVFLGAQQGKLTPSGGSDILVTPVAEDAQTISLTPTNRVTPATFTVTVPADLHDAAGNLVQLPAGAWTFTAPAWLPVGDGSPLNVDAAKDAQAVFTFTRSELGNPQTGISDGRRRGGIARGAGSDLWVASVDTDAAGAGTAPLVVRRWDGATWSTLPSNPTANAGEAVLSALGATPVVAYTEGTELRVRRWTGSAWAAFETPAAPLNASGTPIGIALALDPAGNPAVAWIDTLTLELRVRRWLGAAWGAAELVTAPVTDPGTVISNFNGYAAGAASLATDGTELVVAVVKLTDVDPDPILVTLVDAVNVFRRDAAGPTWTQVGGSHLSAFAATNPGTQPCMVLSQGKPVVGWIVNDGCTTCPAIAVVTELGATTWGNPVPLNRDSNQYAVALQVALPTSGRFTAVWHEGPSTPYRSYASWQDTATLETLAGPFGGGLLETTRAVAPFLVLDAANVPVVLHQELSGTTMQIFVRRYNATALP